MSNMEFQYSHLIYDERCKGRLDCIRACPTKALRYRNKKIIFLKNFCINCGICLQICKEKVFVPDINVLEDSKAFEYQIVIPSPMLYTQFNKDIHPLIIHEALKKIGFNEVIDVSEINDELGFALKYHLNNTTGPRPLISIHCPSVLRLIQVKYPNLIEHISKFDVPQELAAREIKRATSKKLGITSEKIGITYISACLAKVVSIKQPVGAEQSWFDIAISLRHAYNKLLPEILEIQKLKKNNLSGNFYFGKDSGFFNHITLFEDNEKYLYVTGISNIMKIFDDIENGKLRNIQYIEPLSCLHGCVNGVFCVENPYIASHNSIQLMKKFGVGKGLNETKVIEKYKKGYYFLESPILPRPTRLEQQDVSISIKRMRQKERIFLKLPQKNCSLCGSPNCEIFAEDCACGEADIANCIFFQMNTSSHAVNATPQNIIEDDQTQQHS